MSGKVIYQEVVRELESSRASIRCGRLADLLDRLGFEVRDGRKSGHKVFVHPGLSGFASGSYTCGHGRNPEIKPAYIRNVLRILRQYEAELTELLEK